MWNPFKSKEQKKKEESDRMTEKLDREFNASQKKKRKSGKGFDFKLSPSWIFAILFFILGAVLLFVNIWIGIAFILLGLIVKFYKSFSSRERFKMLKMLGGGFKFTILVIVVVGFIWLATIGWDTPWVQSNIVPTYENVKLKVSESGVGGFFSKILNPGDELRRYGSFEDEVLKREGIGVKMSKLESIEPRFPSGGPITVQSKIEAAGMSDESSEVYFKCELDTYTGSIGIDPYGKDSAAILPPRGDELDQTIRCIFEEGLVTTTTTNTKTAKLTATFESFFGQALYPLVLTSTKDSAEKVDLKEYSSEETGVFVNNIGYSIVSPGPIRFEVGIDKEQPFIDEDIAFLEVNIQVDSRIDLNEVDSLGLFVPSEYIQLRTGGNRCDFEHDGTYGEFVVYRPNDEAREKLNEDCKTRSCKNSKKDITLSCYFDVDSGDLEDGDLIESRNILLEAYYSFDIYSTTPVTVRNAAQS